jgi:hypothetical protein
MVHVLFLMFAWINQHERTRKRGYKRDKREKEMRREVRKVEDSKVMKTIKERRKIRK